MKQAAPQGSGAAVQGDAAPAAITSVTGTVTGVATGTVAGVDCGAVSGAGRVLRAAVVDDDRLTRWLVRRALEAAGFDVEEADCGAGGLRLAQSGPDVMVLDLQLPDMSGLAVCRAVIASVPVVFLTAAGDDTTADLCSRSGASDCVQKPVTLVDLGQRVMNAVRVRRAATACTRADS